MTKKGPNFGLPSIGSVNVAASLIRTRADREVEQAGDDLAEEVQATTRIGPIEPIEPTKPTFPERSVQVPHLSTAAISDLRKGGRPKGPPSQRMHLAIEEKMAKYLVRAWRTHERPDGSLAMGPADLIEDLLAEHQRRSAR